MGIFGGGSAPSYNMSEPYKKLTYDTLYPKLTGLIDAGGLGLDTATLERTAKENIAAGYGGAFNKIRAFTAPYGNPAAGNRLALRTGMAQAGEESRAIGGIRTANAQGKNASLMGLLGLAGGMEDPALKQYFADLQRYQIKQQGDAGMAGLLGDLATLGVTAWNPAAGMALGAARGAGGGTYTGGGSGSYAVNAPSPR